METNDNDRWSARDGLAGIATALLEKATPELYRSNAFRLLDLPTDVSTRDLNRRAAELTLARKYGNDSTCHPRVYGLDVPDAQGVRDSLLRLADPAQRLMDEFFWLWPLEPGAYLSDVSLASCRKGDLAAALAAWRSMENSRGHGSAATHNIAVLAHAMALDYEFCAARRSLTEDERAELDGAWQTAYRRWKPLLEDSGLWNRLTTRVSDLSDPRLTVETVQRFREALPVALLTINVKLAIRAAERGQRTDLGRHAKIVQNCGFDPNAVSEAMRRSMALVRERVRTFCQMAMAAAAADPLSGDQAARRLLDQTRPLLDVLGAFLGNVQSGNDGARDEAAMAALKCQAEFANRTEDWKTALHTLRLIQPLAVSPATMGRINEGLQAVEANLRRSDQLARCWFCGQNAPDMDTSPRLALHQIIPPMGNQIRTPIRWRSMQLPVPRCRDCRRTHERPKILAALGVAAGCAAVVAMATVAGNTPGPPLYQLLPLRLVMLCCLCLIGFGGGIGAAVGWLQWPRGVKSVDAAKHCPLVQETIDSGWSMGEEPNQMIYLC